jgi:hypothetical protein
MDANAYALSVQPATKSLGAMIRGAVWMGKGPAPERVPGADLAASPVVVFSLASAPEPEPIAHRAATRS